jgi:hypothetical protein
MIKRLERLKNTVNKYMADRIQLAHDCPVNMDIKPLAFT